MLKLAQPKILIGIGIFLYFLNTQAQSDFAEVANSKNVIHAYTAGTYGGGVSFADFNQDGWDDLTFATADGETMMFFENQSGTFSQIGLGVTTTCQAKQILWTDFDNDGDKDLFINCAYSQAKLFKNMGGLSMMDISDEIGLPDLNELAFGANWADFDRDGWLDLYITYYGMENQLYLNDQGNALVNISNASGVSPQSKPSFCAVVFDYDNDGWEDIYVANDKQTKNDLIANMDGNNFIDLSIPSNSDLAMNAMGNTVLDMNHDGFFEVYVSNSPEGNALLLNKTDGTYQDIAAICGTIFNSVGWGVNTLDFNNDRFWDLYVSGSTVGISSYLSSALYQAINENQFINAQLPGMVGDTVTSFSNAVGDFNNDGKSDIAVNNFGFPSQLWENVSVNNKYWLKVDLEGRISNREGIGSSIALYSGGNVSYQYHISGTSFMGQNTDYIHFGMDDNNLADSIIVYWPSGVIDKITNVSANQVMAVTEGSSGQIIPLSASQNVICSGEAVQLSANIFGRDWQILWSDGSSNNSIDVTVAGQYWATISSGSLVLKTDTLNLVVEENPEVSINTLPANGNTGGSIDIQPMGGTLPFTFTWDHDININSGTISNLFSGTYAVTITTPGGCSITEEIIIDNITSLEDGPYLPFKFWSRNQQLFIEFENDFQNDLEQLTVFNLMGQVSFQKLFDNHQTRQVIIPVQGNQLYILYFQTSSDTFARKVFVK